jgi:hypothetical protein
MRNKETAAYIAPFFLFIGLLALERLTGLAPEWALALRFFTVLLAILLLSRPYLSFRIRRPAIGIALGALVFLLWIGPDILFQYRHYWLFENAVTGVAQSTLPFRLHHNATFLAFRIAISVIVVPIMEELFWRGWLMRWLIDRDWSKVPLGTYEPVSFWSVALLFATEHGPYWEVGLLAGIAYNWWMVRTKSLADCILAHAVTNALLAAYVIGWGQWQYWL